MKRLFIQLFAFSIFHAPFSIPVCLANSTWQSVGPFGGNAGQVAFDPTNSQTMYVATGTGAFKSTNGGASWSTVNSGLSDTKILGILAFDPVMPQTLYATTASGVLKSTDSGASWNAANFVLPAGRSTAPVIDPSNNQTMYVGTGTGVFKSTNGGASWSASSTGLTLPSINSLIIDPTTPQTLYTCTGYDVFKSTNGGGNWSATGTGIPYGSINTLALDPANPRTVYAGRNGGVSKSTDGGASWSSTDTGNPFIFVGSLAIDPASSQTVYAVARGGVYKSNDGGTTWSAINAGLPFGPINGLTIDPASPKKVYVSTWNGGVYMSINGGTSWNAASAGLDYKNITTLAVDPLTPKTVYASAPGGIYKSTTGGTTWSIVTNGLPNSPNAFVGLSLVIDPTATQTVYVASSNGVSKSTDGGASWSAAGTGLGGSAKFLAMAPGAPQTLYAGTSRGVFKSTNGGASWSAANTGMAADTNITSLVIDPAAPQTLYAGTGSRFSFGTIYPGSGVFKSTDGGTGWSAVNTGLPNTTIGTLAIDPGTPQTLYVETEKGLFKSTNGGTSWASIGNWMTTSPNGWAFALDPNNSQTIYLWTKNGLFKSTNGGTNWSASGLSVANIYSLVVDPTDSQTIFVATSEGVIKHVPSFTPMLTTPMSATFTAGGYGSFKISAAGWPTPVLSLKGAMPNGVSFDAGTGTIGGTPAPGSAGTYPLMFTAGNGLPPDAVKAVTMTVVPASSLGVTIAGPAGNTALSAVTGIAGAATGTGLSAVEVQVTDGTYYLQSDGSFGPNSAWLTAAGTSSWILNTASVAWVEGIAYTVNARVNAGTTATASFRLQPSASKQVVLVSASFAPGSIRAGDSATLTGTLLKSDATALAGRSVKFIITPPSTVAVPRPNSVIGTTITDAGGNFSSGILSSFATPGIYAVQARFEGDATSQASSQSLSLPVVPQSGYAIIVSGKATDNSLLDMHTATTDNVYATLVGKRGFLTGNINYLKSTTSAAVTKQQIQDAITVWAKNKLVAAPAPLYLVMIDHGTTDGFVVGDQTITPDELAGWLNTLETDSAVVASGAPDSDKRFVIIGTCYSGSFVPKLSKPGRIIITSAGADEQSLAGFSIYNSATSTTYSGGEYFIDTMINFLGRGDSFKDAVMQSSSNVALRDPRKAGLGQHSGVYDTLAQHPLLDDNGDGAASYLPSSANDGVQTADLTMGVGIKTPGNPADITAVTGTAIIPPTQTGDCPLWLQVNDNSRIAKAWLELRTPITSVSGTGGTGQIIPRLITQPLYYDGLQWNSSYSFPNAGTYNILYYTQDNRTGDISPAAHSVVYKQLANNTAPSTFSLVSPADEGTVSPMFPLTWQEVTSNNSITYTLLVATDQNFDSIVYKEESIREAATYIADDKLRNPASKTYYCQNGDSYCYWKVKAIDRYGAVTESNSRSFTVVATNGLPAFLYGYVRDSITGAPIGGAKISTGSSSFNSLANGAYLFVVPAGSLSLNVSATGYRSKTLSNVITAAGKVVSNNIGLSASVTIGPGDCNGDGIVTISEAKNAVDMLLGLKPLAACVNSDNSGGVSVSEVQKVLNSFLGQ